MVYASSNHAVGMTPRGEEVDAGTRPRPDGVTSYGVSQNTCGGQGGAYRLDREEDRAWLQAALAGDLPA